MVEPGILMGFDLAEPRVTRYNFWIFIGLSPGFELGLSDPRNYYHISSRTVQGPEETISHQSPRNLWWPHWHLFARNVELLKVEEEGKKAMARAIHQNRAGTFFSSTLILWLVSVFFEILFNKRTELIPVLAGGCFYQLANLITRFWISRDPLFVNTCVSLLHSTVTSASG